MCFGNHISRFVPWTKLRNWTNHLGNSWVLDKNVFIDVSVSFFFRKLAWRVGALP